MTRALLVDLDDATLALLRGSAGLRHAGLETVERPQALGDRLGSGEEVDAVVIGPRAAEPIATAQRTFRQARDAAVLLVAHPERFEALRRELSTAPFVGAKTVCRSAADGQALVRALEEALEASARRRRNRRTLEAINPHLSATPALRPRAVSVLDRLLELAPVGVLAATGGGTILVANPAAVALLGAGTPLVGSELRALVADGSAAGWTAAVELALRGGTGHALLERTGGAGARALEAIVAELPLAADVDAGGTGLLIILQDATERTELDRQRTEAVRNLNEVIRLRDEFLAVAAHELKTPLTPLLLKLQMVLRSASRQGLTPAVTEQVSGAERQARKLSVLVDGLLDVSRLTAGKLKLHLEPVDLAAVVREAADQHEQQAEGAGCALRVDAPEPVIGQWDRVRVDQVFTALLTNAIKYGAGRPIAVRVRRKGELGVLEVSDEGIGISAVDQSRIFRRFERAVSERNYGGLGLGLFIASNIVQSLGGRIALASAVGEGSRFTVELPLRPAEDGRAAARSPPRPG